MATKEYKFLEKSTGSYGTVEVGGTAKVSNPEEQTRLEGLKIVEEVKKKEDKSSSSSKKKEDTSASTRKTKEEKSTSSKSTK